MGTWFLRRMTVAQQAIGGASGLINVSRKS